MNANELIEFQEDNASEARANGFSDVRFMQTAAMLRQQQAEIAESKVILGHYEDVYEGVVTHPVKEQGNPVAWRSQDPYGWHCFIGKGKEEQDFLFINGKGASKPDASWDKVIPLYTNPAELTDEERLKK